MKKINEDKKYIQLDKNDEQNLYKFFELLFKVDVRNNPHLYKKKKLD